MRSRRLWGIAVIVMASGCGMMPWDSLSEPPPECRGYITGRSVEWTGHGTPDEFGLTPEGEGGTSGDIYVGTMDQPDGPLRMWCMVEEGAVTGPQYGEVPDNWVRPP